jgi:hypothetical protein
MTFWKPSGDFALGRRSVEGKMSNVRAETDSLGSVDVPADKLWGAQTQRSLQHFSIGHELIPREMIAAYAVLKRAVANYRSRRLSEDAYDLIIEVCDELLDGRHQEMFPLHVWIDRKRYAVQHERQRGHFESLLPARPYAAWQ